MSAKREELYRAPGDCEENGRTGFPQGWLTWTAPNSVQTEVIQRVADGPGVDGQDRKSEDPISPGAATAFHSACGPTTQSSWMPTVRT